MTMSPGLRKLALTVHVVSSVGWLGAVAAFLTLSIAGLVSEDGQTVRGAYLVMKLTGWYLLVPLSIASLLTGLLCSLGTRWGLFRHYWVLAKLVINVFATVVLVMYMQTLDTFATAAADPSLTSSELLMLRNPSPVLHAGAALPLLIVASVLGVYKPRGVTRYGWRKQQEARTAAQP